MPLHLQQVINSCRLGFNLVPVGAVASEAEIESDFLEALLETGWVLLEVAEEEGGNFVKCSFDNDYGG